MFRVAVFAAALGLVLVATPGRASLYTPDEPMPFGIGKDGLAEPLPFDEFKRRLIVAMNRLNPAPPTDGKVNTDREVLVKSVEKRKAAKNPPPLEAVSLAVDLLRLRDPDAALNLLKVHENRRQPDYLVSTSLAHVHAMRQEWRAAQDMQALIHPDADIVAPPAQIKGLTKPQRDWVLKLDADYVLPYLAYQARDAEAKVKRVYEEEDVFPLFPVPKRNQPHTPVRFVNEKGEYEPGAIAAAEKAKLPPDALAITQQMMLWFSDDTRLYWLLAELYAAEGEIESALKILNECVDTGRKYSGRRLLGEHRAAVMAAVEKKQKAEEELRKQQFPITLRAIAIYFGVAAAVAILAGVRALRRRKRA